MSKFFDKKLSELTIKEAAILALFVKMGLGIGHLLYLLINKHLCG